MSYHAKTTTNNQAEYRGLLQGLLQAHRSRMIPLHVVCDNKMIIEQQRKRHSPRFHESAQHYTHLYKRCRVLADKCNVLSWTHHIRSFNKTADTLANLAMNTQHSRQLQVYSRDNIVESIQLALRFDHTGQGPVTSTTDWEKNAICHRCKQPGHIAPNCPTK
ncbi:hypothetical protein PHMEG_00036376 [Phytophthora megakarya]|uniref:CCHC-type domain-containing protein n=1 Tax=Phytophthora megakarya TaxID=4795 RepID=A0A225ULA0_9STRA|nr:hypothetical protein PHMEG_00036376 [Phytophthora megakarya]